MTAEPSKFRGTNNPRHLRVIHALMVRPQTREHVDGVAGASNGPELIAELRRRGLEIPCDRVECIDRDGKEVKRGVYFLTRSDRTHLSRWLSKRNAGAGGAATGKGGKG